MDDRFDFQLVSGELLDSEGLSYIPGTYHTFGNNGSTYDGAVNVDNSISFSGITSFSKTQVLNALESASDHLPVVADYQIPAYMEAELGAMVPSNLNQGESFSLDLLVRNAANVVAAAGADELDFSYATTGDLTGSGSGTAFAMGSDSSFSIALDTTTKGVKAGSIIVTTSSPSAANSFIRIPVSYQVGEGGRVIETTLARAVFPNVADDLNVTGFVFTGDLTTEDTSTSSGGTLPVGSDAQKPGVH